MLSASSTCGVARVAESHQSLWIKCWPSLAVMTHVFFSNSFLSSRCLMTYNYNWPTKILVMCAECAALLADSLCLVKEQRPASINKVATTPFSKGGHAPTTRNVDVAGMCFYHARFGSKAKKCTPPCTFLGNNQAGCQ